MKITPEAEWLDVLIIGAGLSGIGLAYYLQKNTRNKSFAILESRHNLGGTWDLFRYPGIRSDSDLHTFGYQFKPWLNDSAIASGPDILAYITEVAQENGIDKTIRYQHQVIRASWSSATASWTVVVAQKDSGQEKTFCCRWLFSAAGYYRYDQGYSPQITGMERFKGPVIHPQHWPEDLDYSGKKVVVIGSGATAVTLVPAMAEQAAHVTMLQRTPTYVISMPSKDVIANGLNRLIPVEWSYSLTRQKNIALSRAFWLLCKEMPQTAKHLIQFTNKVFLPKAYPVDVHFNPPYSPWDQRLCAVPDGDLFHAIKHGKASIVTDHIATVTEDGITTQSGKHLPADIIITATGLNIQLFGGIQVTVDGQAIDFAKQVTFKSMLLSDVPNFAFAIGYTNSSWTLKVDLVCEHFCKILAHMDKHGYTTCIPHHSNTTMPTRPLLDFGSGYVQRALDFMPRRGTVAPWSVPMNYYEDVRLFKKGSVIDPALKFSHHGAAS